jgi:hypothetical protein
MPKMGMTRTQKRRLLSGFANVDERVAGKYLDGDRDRIRPSLLERLDGAAREHPELVPDPNAAAMEAA